MIREIQTFLSICEHGTFANAAEQLNLTQSAVSAQIKNLEKQLGFALFNRSRRGAVLSDEGERVLPIAKQIVELFDEMSAVSGKNTQAVGMKLGIHHTIQAQIAPVLLPLLPKNIQIKLLDNIKLLDEIRQNQQHVAIMVQPDVALANDLTATLLFRDECVLIAPKNSGNDYATLLATAPILAYDAVAFGNQSLTAFFRQHRATSPLLTSHDAATLVDLVAQNMGVTVLPKSSLKNKDLSNVTVLPVPLAREIVVVSLSNFAAQNQAIGTIWQHGMLQQQKSNQPHTWQHTHEIKEEFGLPKMILTEHYRN